MLSVGAALIFLACVALASVIQNLTAFAFGLILIACVEMLGLVPIADVTNASMVLAAANAMAFFWGDRRPLPWAAVRHILWTSLVGVAAGVGLQVWLSDNASHALRFLLGAVVILSAANLLLGRRARTTPSPPAAFAFFGALSGLLGGLFATSGPPIVYHLMRQPFDPREIRRQLMLVFAVNNLARLAIVAGAGRFSALSALLCGMALPVAFGVTWWCKRHLPDISRQHLMAGVAALLGATGLSLMMSALHAG